VDADSLPSSAHRGLTGILCRCDSPNHHVVPGKQTGDRRVGLVERPTEALGSGQSQGALDRRSGFGRGEPSQADARPRPARLPSAHRGGCRAR
jgi:hypothetical protein